MRKLLYLFLTFLALSFQSCLKEDEDFFDKSASERMSSTLETYKSILVASKDGWALEYYPEENQSYGGYVYTIKFTDDDATVALDIAGSAITKTGLYKLVGDDGPVLTFDTYNLLMHYFANPSEDATDGQRGDYEFILMGHEGNVITLKGKRSGNKMTLTKLTEPYDTFIEKVNLSRSTINGVPKIGVKVGGEAILAEKTSSKFSFTYTEGGKETAVSVAYVPTTTGVKLYEPITIKGEKFQNFTYNSDGLGMTCSTNPKVVISFIYPPLNEMMAVTSAYWKFQINGSNMCSGLSSLLASAIATNTAEYGETVTLFAVGLNPLYPAKDNVNKYAFIFVSSGYASTYGYSMTPVTGTTDQVSISLTTSAMNWSYYTWFMPPIKYIADHSPYKVETDNERNPSYVKYVSVADPTIWFRVDK